VPLGAELLQDVAQGGAGAQRRGAVDAEALGQLVGRLEAEAPHVGGQAVRVGPHQLQRALAVGLVDAHRPRRADAVRLEEDHDAAHRLLLLPALADALDAPGADALDLLEVRRALVDDFQGALAEHVHDLAGEVGADALDQPRAEVLDDALAGVRRHGAQAVGLELRAVVAVLHPRAGRLDVLAGGGAGEVADDRDEAAAAVGLHAQHREAALGVVRGHALDDAG
jgi:hypothetical protein